MLVGEAWQVVEPLRLREAEFRDAIRRTRPPGSLAAALRGPHVAVIAELKRRSPSGGAINPAMSAGPQARAYDRGGARALSILTEVAHFGGSTDDLREAGAAVSLPLLKKDFHVAPIQALEARALGAAAMLLIARALSPEELLTMATAAEDAGVESLVEVRDERELERALRIDGAMIGINNRNLETLAMDMETAQRLLPLVPRNRLAVFESGVRSRADVTRAASAGADAVLVGSAVSAAADPAAAVRALVGVPRVDRRD